MNNCQKLFVLYLPILFTAFSTIDATHINTQSKTESRTRKEYDTIIKMPLQINEMDHLGMFLGSEYCPTYRIKFY